MNESVALRRLLQFLQVMAAFLFVGTIAELWMMKHYDGALQLLPFGLCVAGLLAIVVAGRVDHPVLRRMVLLLMIAIALSSLIGVWEHIEGNLGFIQEVRPHAPFGDKLRAVLQGRAPLLAPGILAIAATFEASALATIALLSRQPAPAPVPSRRRVLDQAAR